MMSELRYRTAVPIFFRRNGKAPFRSSFLKIADLTTVPIAIPMIAGPATITAAVTFPVQYSRFVTIVAILLALAVNLFFMLKARRIGSFLIKYNFMNPLIRIIGLIVATIGLQMVFDGITLFIKTLA